MIQDSSLEVPVHDSVTQFQGHVWQVRSDTLTFGESTFTRDYVAHTGAVGVIAIDDELNMLLVHQYRHPHAALMWEPPAGLLDVPGESPLTAAQRELVEETGYEAGTWHTLADIATTPGGSSEAARIYLAQGVRQSTQDRGVALDEEANMEARWVPVTEVLASIQSGAVSNVLLVTGTYALLAALAQPELLRPAEAAWPARERVATAGRLA